MDPTKRTRDLTAMVGAGGLNPVIGWDDEIIRCIQILCRRTKNNPVLIGEAGVRKTAICQGLAERISEGDVPQELTNRRLISLDMDEVMAGVKHREEFEDRLNTVFKEVTAGQNVLIIDEIHPHVGAAGGTDGAMDVGKLTLSFTGGTDGAMDVGKLLKPMLGRGKLQCIVATTLREYENYIEKDRALERQFHQIYVGEPTVKYTIPRPHPYYGYRVREKGRYVNGRFSPDNAAVKWKTEAYTKQTAIDEMSREIVALMKEQYYSLNDKEKVKLIDAELSRLNARESVLKKEWEHEQRVMRRMRLIKEEIDKVKLKIQRAKENCCLNLTIKHKYQSLNSLQRLLQAVQLDLDDYKMRCEESMLKEKVTADDIVVEEVSEWTVIGIPLSMSKMEKHEELHKRVVGQEHLQLEEELHKRVVGQDHAVQAVAQAIQRFRAGFSDPHRPIASFMFMGPTGVGKTKLAEALADALSNDKEALVRIYMSNYMEDDAISRLIGPPLGYIGYEMGGQLTEIVLKKQHPVILFEQIEKARPDVFNLLCQILGDGRVKDSQGQIVDFSKTVIIMTSNVGSQYILDTNDDSLTKEMAFETMRQKVMEAAREIFRPEFMNQVDECIVFQPFDVCQITQIVRLELGMVEQKLAHRRISIEVTDAAVELLGSLAYSPNCGARPVKRVIREFVQKELAKGLMRGEFKENDTVLVDTEATTSGDGQLPQQKLIFKKLGSAHSGAVSPSC